MNDTNMADIPWLCIYRVCPGMASKARKNTSQLSTNKYIKRARDYIIKLIKNNLEFYRAKARNTSIISTLKKYFMASARYQNASKEERLRIEVDDKKIVIYYR